MTPATATVRGAFFVWAVCVQWLHGSVHAGLPGYETTLHPPPLPPPGTGKLEGRAEQLLGRFKNEYPGSAAVRDNVRIATKLAAYPWRLTPQQVRGMPGGDAWALAFAAVLRSSQRSRRGSTAAVRQSCCCCASADGNTCPFAHFCHRPCLQWVSACRASLARAGQDKLALAQLHWSTANYAPLQERLMWDGLCAIYDAVRCWICFVDFWRGGCFVSPRLLCFGVAG